MHSVEIPSWCAAFSCKFYNNEFGWCQEAKVWRAFCACYLVVTMKSAIPFRVLWVFLSCPIKHGGFFLIAANASPASGRLHVNGAASKEEEINAMMMGKNANCGIITETWLRPARLWIIHGKRNAQTTCFSRVDRQEEWQYSYPRIWGRKWFNDTSRMN